MFKFKSGNPALSEQQKTQMCQQYKIQLTELRKPSIGSKMRTNKLFKRNIKLLAHDFIMLLIAMSA